MHQIDIGNFSSSSHVSGCGICCGQFQLNAPIVMIAAYKDYFAENAEVDSELVELGAALSPAVFGVGGSIKSD